MALVMSGLFGVQGKGAPTPSLLTAAAPQPPVLTYGGLGLAIQKAKKRVQAGGIFDRQTAPQPSLLQRAILALAQPKTLLGS